MIDCEKCRHFAGSSFWRQWACTKGHAQEKEYAFIRESCADNAPMARDELIYKRFSMGVCEGDQKFKNHAASLKRVITGLRNEAQEGRLGPYMNAEQLKAINGAVLALSGLADDISRAAKIAKKKKEEEEKARATLKAAVEKAMAAVFPAMDFRERILFGLWKDPVGYGSRRKRLDEFLARERFSDDNVTANFDMALEDFRERIADAMRKTPDASAHALVTALLAQYGADRAALDAQHSNLIQNVITESVQRQIETTASKGRQGVAQ